MTDPFGVILAILRADAGVAAIASTRIGAEPADTLPCVVIGDLATTRRPFGSRSGNLGLQLWMGFARCYGADSPTGAINARALAGAVSDALHGHGATRGSSSRWMLRSYAADLDGLVRDPDTHWPYYDVRIDGYFAAGAVA
jgi:hypothetical protein